MPKCKRILLQDGIKVQSDATFVQKKLIKLFIYLHNLWKDH